MQAIHSEYQLRAPFLVLVEGKSDEVMLKSAMAQWFPALSAVQILPYHSKDKLGSMLKILCNQPEFKQVNRLAIFRDADDNATSAFQSVQQHLRKILRAFQVTLCRNKCRLCNIPSDCRLVFSSCLIAVNRGRWRMCCWLHWMRI